MQQDPHDNVSSYRVKPSTQRVEAVKEKDIREVNIF